MLRSIPVMDVQNIVIHSFEFPEAWVDTSRLDHRLLAVDWYQWRQYFIPS